MAPEARLMASATARGSLHGRISVRTIDLFLFGKFPQGDLDDGCLRDAEPLRQGFEEVFGLGCQTEARMFLSFSHTTVVQHLAVSVNGGTQVQTPRKDAAMSRPPMSR